MPKRQSAFFQAVKEAQEAEEEKPGDAPKSETVEPLNSETVSPLHRETPSRLNLPTVKQSQAGSSAETEKTLLHRETVKSSNSATVKPSNRSTVKAELVKTSFYLSQEQLDRLDELAYAYKRQTGKRINRNDIIRFLVERARLETLLAEW